MDGKTNLKPWKAVNGTSTEEDILEWLSFHLDSEPLHQNLYQYHGVLWYDDPTYCEQRWEPVTINELLLVVWHSGVDGPLWPFMGAGVHGGPLSSLVVVMCCCWCWWGVVVGLCHRSCPSVLYPPPWLPADSNGLQLECWNSILESAGMVRIYHSAGFRWNQSGILFQQILMESKWNSIPIQVHSARFQGPFQHIPGEILFQWIPSAIQMSCDLV